MKIYQDYQFCSSFKRESIKPEKKSRENIPAEALCYHSERGGWCIERIMKKVDIVGRGAGGGEVKGMKKVRERKKKLYKRKRRVRGWNFWEAFDVVKFRTSVCHVFYFTDHHCRRMQRIEEARSWIDKKV